MTEPHPEGAEAGDEGPDDAEDPNDVENAWAAEIERRRREVRDGTRVPIEGEAFLRELRAWKPGSRS